MGIFSVDGPIYRFVNWLWAAIKINFMWMIFSLPIVTLGGATIAAFDVFMRMCRGEEGYPVRDFTTSFRKNFKTGIPYGLLLLFSTYAVWLNFSLFEQIEGNPIVLLIMGMVGAFLVLLIFLFAFALQARYENTFLRTLKNSVDICTRFFVRTLTLLVVLAVEVFFFAWNTTTLLLGLVIGPACIMYTISAYANIFFSQLEQEPGAVIIPGGEEEKSE